jgi:hypothetical protein
MQKIFIVDSKNSIKKVYSKEGYYVIDAHANQNVVEIDRITKTTNGILEFEAAKPDYILNAATISESTVQVNKRVTDLMLIEYYISMSLTSSMATFPEVEHTVNTVITEDTTVRINRTDVQDAHYIAYAYGDIVALTPDLGVAIAAADQSSGIVLDSFGQVIWERGVKSSKSSVTGIRIIGNTDNMTSLQACLQMLINYKNSEGGTYNRLQQSVITYLNQYLAATPVKVEGITLDETLHFIYKGKPVIGFKKTGDAVLIVGYDKTHITIIDPEGRTEKKLLQKDAATMFLEAGNMFVTYID